MLEDVDVTRDNSEQGADLCGPNPDVQTGESWRERAVVRIEGDQLPVSNELFASLVNVAAVTFDLLRAGMRTDESGTIDLSTDGDVSTVLIGFPAGKEINVDETSTVSADDNGRANIELSPGSHRLTW
jgi:hypothetical protein